MRPLKQMLVAAFAAWGLVGCTGVGTPGGSGVVVLDIGHCVESPGAREPGNPSLEECRFWYKYSYDVKREIERAGYRCTVCNRGNGTGLDAELASYARRAGVVHLRRPGKGGERYPSRYHPDRVGSGVVSADYAIYRHAAAAVFLHHNSSGGRTSGASPSIIICNRYNGRPLASAIASSINADILNHGMPNGGRSCSVQVRYVDADRSASWMNACDDSGIPAAVVEAAFLNNTGHASFLRNDANARRYARAIGRGIVNYLRHPAPRHIRQNENQADEGSFGYAAESRRLTVPGAKVLAR